MKAVIYDMDDLMVNTFPLHERVTDTLLAKYGHSRAELSEDMKKTLLGVELLIFVR